MRETKKSEKKQEGMWDVLIPVLLVIVALPLLVRLAVYSCGYSDYAWYAQNDILTDFYCYYKSCFVDITGIFAGIILLFRLGLYRDKTKNMKIYIPVGIYAVFVLLSSLFSVNKAAAFQGNFESFEGCMVLLSYVVLSLYAYQVMEYERDYRFIWYAVVVITVIFIVIGAFQIFRYDLMNYEWMQRLLMTKEEFELYGGEIETAFTGSNVYLTLYNPNYAGITLNMLFAVIFVMFVSEADKKKKTAYGILSVGGFILIWYTYSRASLLAVGLTIVTVVVHSLRKDRQKINKTYLAAGFAGMLVLLSVLIAADAGNDFKYISRMLDKDTREPLESMITDERGIHICYDGRKYLLSIEEAALVCETVSEGTVIRAKEGDEMNLPMEKGAKAYYYENEIYVYIAENTLTFTKENEKYYYVTASGKITEMTEIEAVDFHGLEYLGSARGYIWSRTLPLMKKYSLTGSGPDTFAEVFPQNDFAGKTVYSDRPDRIIEKAHNDYLTKWIQTGGISLLCIVVFYLLFIRKGMSVFQEPKEWHERIGYGCYLACISYMFTSIFNDSTLQTSPLFWVFAGIALSSAVRKTENKDGYA